MTRFETQDQFQLELIKLGDSENLEDFFSYQHFIFGCANWLRGHLAWPKVQDAYNKCKLAIGCRSIFIKTPGWRDFSAFRGEHRKSVQYILYQLFSDLQEHQEMWMLMRASWYQVTKLWKHIPPIQLSGIWEDTVVQRPKYQKTYPIEIRRMGWEIRSGDKYKELGVLGDICEDMGFMEEADHFHNPDCLHTYGCRWLHNVCRGMDGR